MARFGAFLLLASALVVTRTAAQVSPPPYPRAISPRLTSPPASHWGSSRLSAADFRSNAANVPWVLPFPLQDPVARRHKSPFLAWFLSWLVPGGGQGYNGQWVKAAAFFGGAMVGVALVASNDGFVCSGDCGTRDAGLALLVVSSLGSQIDAPITAAKINRQAREAAVSRITLSIATVAF